MLSKGTLIELMGSLAQNNYFEGEPLFVVAADEGFYDVIEGNRRLAAVKLLLNPNLATRQKGAVSSVANTADVDSLRQIPCLIYENRESLLAFLGYRHITGVKQWGALQKAKYLKQIQDYNSETSFSDLAKLIGSRTDYVARLLTALALYEHISSADFYKIENLNDETINFSFLTTALSFSNITRHLGLENDRNPQLNNLHTERLKWLVEVMFKETANGQTRLGESRNIKNLATIIGHPQALEKFNTNLSIDDALLWTDEPSEMFRQLLAEAREKLSSSINRLPHAKDVNQSDLETVNDMRDQLIHIRNTIRSRLSSDDSWE
jgi:hypothetical protein